MAGELGAGGYHWQSSDQVAEWDARKQALASDRREGFELLLNALPEDRSAALRVLDLGAGDGKVAETILDEYPHAQAVLVDFSEPMIEKGIQQLRRLNGRFAYVRWDMNDGDWPDVLAGPYEVMASSAAIHHLDNPRKRWLAGQVIERLVPGGVFANYDLYRDPDAQFGEEEVHDRNCATLEEATTILGDAGYVGITVAARSPRPAHKGELALVLASRARTGRVTT
jgi:trans-aconitate methyltransferase